MKTPTHRIRLAAIVLLALVAIAETDDKKDTNAEKGIKTLLEKTVDDEGIREKITDIFDNIPMSDKSQGRAKRVLLELGVNMSTGNRGFLAIIPVLIGIITDVAQLVTTIVYSSNQPRPGAPPPNIDQPTPPPPTGKPNNICKPCCTVESKAVCFVPDCPPVPTNKSICADMPLCYPPCKLQVRQHPDRLTTERPDDDYDYDGDGNGDEDYDFEIDLKRNAFIDLKGVKLFDDIMQNKVKNETIRKLAANLFGSMHETIEGRIRYETEDVFKHFKDKNIVNLKPDSGQVLKGILGHVYHAAIEKANRPSYTPRPTLRPGPSTTTLMPRWIHPVGTPLCPPCEGSCKTEPKMCHLTCPNNPGCILGQCVCGG